MNEGESGCADRVAPRAAGRVMAPAVGAGRMQRDGRSQCGSPAARLELLIGIGPRHRGVPRRGQPPRPLRHGLALRPARPIGGRGGALGHRCLTAREVELRMDLMAAILTHDSRRTGSPAAVAGRGRARDAGRSRRGHGGETGRGRALRAGPHRRRELASAGGGAEAAGRLRDGLAGAAAAPSDRTRAGERRMSVGRHPSLSAQRCSTSSTSTPPVDCGCMNAIRCPSAPCIGPVEVNRYPAASSSPFNFATSGVR